MENDYYVIVREGKIQRLMMFHEGSGKPFKSWPVAGTHDDARRLVRHLEGKFGRRLTCYRIGMFPGETFELLAQQAIAEGCGACCCARAWTADEGPLWETIYFDPTLAA